ncbi:MAG TPA: glycosyltransferase family 39 protein [Anaerolineales bacterium]|nr:glycosyltransferase family 39 protein [Anaerolineales bacterium]
MPIPAKLGEKRLLVLVLLAAILIRLPVALYMGDRVTVLPGIHDQVSYDALASSLLAGRGYSFTENWYPFTLANTPTAHWSFLYPVYLAGIYEVIGYHPLVARLVQGTLGGALICFLVYLIGRRVADEVTGLVGAALAAVYGYFIYYNAALMTETFFIVLVLFSLYLSLEIKEKPSLARWALLGLALGAAALLRQTVLLFVPFLLLWLFMELRGKGIRWWYFTIPVGVIILMIAPWTIRNYLVFDQFLLLNSNAGYAFYASNNPNLGTDWNNDKVVVPVPDELKGRNEAELDRALTQRGIKFILADPERYLWLSLDKTLEYFWFWPSATSSRISNLNRVLSFGLFLPFMLLGLYLSFSRWRSFAVLYLFIVIHTGIHLLTWPAPRYRLPVDAVSMIFAGLAVIELARLSRTWRRRLPLINKLGF